MPTDFLKTLKQADDTPLRITAMLELALEQQVSDIHLEPIAAGYELRMRVDGLLTLIDMYFHMFQLV